MYCSTRTDRSRSSDVTETPGILPGSGSGPRPGRTRRSDPLHVYRKLAGGLADRLLHPFELVVQVAQGVDDRYAGVLGNLHDSIVFKSTDHHGIHPAFNVVGDIAQSFAVP